MKFEDLLMIQPSDPPLRQEEKKQTRRGDLQEKVEKLEEELDAQLKLNKILHCALQGPVHLCPCLSKSLPSKVQVLLAELARMEEEIIWLERKVDHLKLSLYHEKHHHHHHHHHQQTKDWGFLDAHPRQKQLQQQQELAATTYGLSNHPMEVVSCRSLVSRSQDFQQHYHHDKEFRVLRERRASFVSPMDILSLPSSINSSYEEIAESSRCSRRRIRNHNHSDTKIGIEKPNELSEQLIKCLIGIFLKLNQASLGRKGSAIVPKHHPLSCMNSRGFISKTAFNYKALPAFSFDNTSNIDPYGIFLDFDGPIRDVGPYKNFIQITRSSLDISHISECFQAMGKLRVLMHTLCNVDLTFLTYKQKLAFWINIYNACIMHAFLQHGLPSTEKKLLALMNKAAINVGGIVLNALAIEHFILRHPSDSKHFFLTYLYLIYKGPIDEKEMILQHAYGLGYPEPNVTFALCRGSMSSPALRVYTSDDIVNELGRAKVEYLEASVGVTSKKKIVVPKLLQWHMRDFADDMQSLLEWIYSELPHSGSLKRLIMECLIGETKSPIAKMAEIQVNDSEFRYLLPL
ncbi:hypothetical protein ACSBR1_027111 [Camellia fascicularis]